MKVLIAYYSQTGNTEKIARAMYDGASQGHEAELIKIGEADASELKAYDFIFIGSPIHGGRLAAPAGEFIEAMPDMSGVKAAGFITHSDPAYPDQATEKIADPLAETLGAKGLEFKGLFTSIGFLTPDLHEMIRKRRNLTDEQWEARLGKMAGHPNEEDVARARAFAEEVLG